MKKIFTPAVTAVLFFFGPPGLLAQNESWNWYFGTNAGVNFSTGSPVAVTNNAFATIEGVATISDGSGNLLFYTDGSNVYNANHVVMPNGSGLLGHPSSTQSAIIVRKPDTLNSYYIFTVDYNHENTFEIGTGFRYSVVDMTLDGGLGDIISAEKNILVRQRAYEKLTAVLHSNNTDFWILINDWVDDAIYAYQLTSAGLDTTPVISDVGPLHDYTLNTLGYMKASKQSDRLALARLEFESFTLLDFDNATGVASNRIDINGTSAEMHRAYGVEFSPDGTKLYGTILGIPYKIIQFDLSSGIGDTIYKYRTILDSTIFSDCSYHFGAVQLGPDGKIYVSVQCDSFLNSINDPDSLGVSSNYIHHAVSLSGRQGQLGLPNFVTSYVLPNSASMITADGSGIEIYPNPALDHLMLSVKDGSNFKNAYGIIADVLGNTISSLALSGNSTRVELQNLPNGIYLLQLNLNGKLVNKKFVISK